MKDYDLITDDYPAPVRQSGRFLTGLGQEVVEDSLESFFCGLNGVGAGLEVGAGTFSPCINVASNDTAIEITIELPGIVLADIRLFLANDMLILKGEKRLRAGDTKKKYYRQECSYGTFRRTIPIPGEMIDSNASSAELKYGVLTVSLPRKKKTQSVARYIPIRQC